MSVAAGVVCLLAAIAPVLIGISSAVTDWSVTAAGPPLDPTATLPWVIAYLTPTTLAVIGLGAVAAAVMSSVDSSVLSASGMSVWNVYRPLFNPEVKPSRLAPLIQRSIWIVGTAATLIAFQVSSVYELWFLCSDFVYCLLFPALVAAFFDPKANAPGALAGFAVAAFLRFGGGDVTLGLPQYLPYPTGADGAIIFPFRTLAMFGGLATIFLVSRFTQERYPARELRATD
jgi:high affinity choline transporter 7